MIRLLIVDDEPLICRGLRAVLKGEPDLELLGEANDGQAALKLVETSQPDVVLMDIRMPVMDGVAATKAIAQRFPHVKVLVLTTFAEDEYISQALRYGAAGYLLKGTPSEELAQAIRAAHKGYLQLGPGVGRQVMTQLPDRPPAPPPEWQDLTQREQEILRLVAAGANNKEIAESLYISEKTVKNHLTNIFSRLGVRDRTQAALFAHSFLRPDT